MALKDLFGWSGRGEEKASSACGAACGAGDKPEEKPQAIPLWGSQAESPDPSRPEPPAGDGTTED